jgi:hypothetical protein
MDSAQTPSFPAIKTVRGLPLTDPLLFFLSSTQTIIFQYSSTVFSDFETARQSLALLWRKINAKDSKGLFTSATQLGAIDAPNSDVDPAISL